MRQLKFRIWDKLQKHYIYSTDFGARHFTISLDGKVYNLQNGAGPDDFVVQQCIDRVNAEGKEIYEGDIIKHCDTCYEIKWCRHGACDIFAFHPVDKDNQHINHYYGEWESERYSHELVGNIFQNPNLLQN